VRIFSDTVEPFKSKPLSTTVAQLNYFKWLITNRVLDYIIKHSDEIDDDMNAQKLQQPTSSPTSSSENSVARGTDGTDGSGDGSGDDSGDDDNVIIGRRARSKSDDSLSSSVSSITSSGRRRRRELSKGGMKSMRRMRVATVVSL
jgi:phosphatidate phosphatase PAH1